MENHKILLGVNKESTITQLCYIHTLRSQRTLLQDKQRYWGRQGGRIGKSDLREIIKQMEVLQQDVKWVKISYMLVLVCQILNKLCMLSHKSHLSNGFIPVISNLKQEGFLYTTSGLVPIQYTGINLYPRDIYISSILLQ